MQAYILSWKIHCHHFFYFQLCISSYEKYSGTSVCVNASKVTEKKKKYLFNFGFNVFDFICVKRQADVTGIAHTSRVSPTCTA